MIILIFVHLYLATSWLHPFYVSTTDVKVNVEQKQIEVLTKLFTDDLEAALKMQYGSAVDLSEFSELNSQLVSQYMQSHFSFTSKGQYCSLIDIAYRVVDDMVYVEHRYQLPKNKGELMIKASFLTDVFDGQKNIVHFRWNEKSGTLLLDKSKPSAAIKAID